MASRTKQKATKAKNFFNWCFKEVGYKGVMSPVEHPHQPQAVRANEMTGSLNRWLKYQNSRVVSGLRVKCPAFQFLNELDVPRA
jgi:hypothetical protein